MRILHVVRVSAEGQYYAALKARDARFDGKFFVGVSSTKIYCRPVCRVKVPLKKNCRFYATAAAAEQAGYRPCLRCRPELAPGASRLEAVSRLAALALQRIEEGALNGSAITDLADEFGVTDRHLRRVLQNELGVAPVELAQTQRLLVAKRLLTDSQIAVSDVAYASGFSSLRRFNALFQQRYRLKPMALRRRAAPATETNSIYCQLAYRPPFAWTELLGFLRARSMAGVEHIDQTTYRRTVKLGGCSGTIAVTQGELKNVLEVKLSAELLPVVVPVLARVRRLFDLDAEPLPIAEHLGSLAAKTPGLRVPGAFDGFEIAIRAILGQQVSVRAATTLAGRFAQKFGESLSGENSVLTHITPTAERVAEASVAEIAALGIVSKRAGSLLALAQAVAQKAIRLEPAVDTEVTLQKLMALPGIGEWTAAYIAMRALQWPDAFLSADLGVMKALGCREQKEILRRAEAWRPWRSYAVMHLWAKENQ